MEKLKQRKTALLLCALIVIGSTLVGIKVKLEEAVKDLEDGFRDGVTVNGESYGPAAEDVRDICDLAEDIIPIAKNYGIDTQALADEISYTRSSLSYGDPSNVGWNYRDLRADLDELLQVLDQTGLSNTHLEAMATYQQSLAAYTQALDQNAAAYDQTVRSFLKSFDRFPANWFADTFSVYYPSYFQQ